MMKIKSSTFVNCSGVCKHNDIDSNTLPENWFKDTLTSPGENGSSPLLVTSTMPFIAGVTSPKSKVKLLSITNYLET